MTKNLVIIVADSLRLNSPLGTPSQPTGMANFSELLGSRGAFCTALASSPWTVPSHDCLLNGVAPWEHGTCSRPTANGFDVGSLARAWRNSGGEAISLSANPVLRFPDQVLDSFADEFPLSVGTLQRLVLKSMAGFDLASAYLHSKGAMKRKSAYLTLHRAAEVLARAASPSFKKPFGAKSVVSSIKRIARRREGANGLFLLVNLYEAHEPYPSAFNRSDPRRLDLSNYPSFNLSFHSVLNTFSPGHVDALRAAYAYWLRRLDESLVEIVMTLNRRDLLRDTMLVVTSDHGQSLGEDGFVGHGRSLSDSVVDIPCWVYLGEDGSPSERTLLPSSFRPDHRQLNALLLSFITNRGTAQDLRTWPELLETMGPSYSYCAGRRITGPDPRSWGPTYRRIRAKKGTAEVEFVSENGNSHLVRRAGGDLDELNELEGGTNRILEQLNRGSAEDGSSLGDTAARLSIWGYE